MLRSIAFAAAATVSSCSVVAGDAWYEDQLRMGAVVLDALPSEYRDAALKAGLMPEVLVVSNNAA